MPHLVRMVSMPVALLMAFSASACQKSNTTPTPVPAPQPAIPGSAVNIPALPSADELLRQAVARELHKDKHIDQPGIQVAAHTGIIELTGQVDNVLSKERATRVAEVVRGVRAVDNRIEVIAPKRPDQDIAQDVQKALAYNFATAKLPIHANVKDGGVVLTGTVGSWQEKQFAERVAEGVRGVRSAQNALDTKLTAKRESSAIAGDVKSRLAWDALVEHDPIEVAVSNGHVTLTGTTGSAAEKTRASGDAWVDGVNGVDATGVEVKVWDRPDKNLVRGTPKSDEQIAHAIKNAAFYDPRVESFNINPSVTGGFVTLTGTVETLQAKRAAEALAHNTVGVLGVTNRLVARSREPLADRLLQDRIEGALAFDPLTDARDIHLTVKSGLVTLTGSVGTYLESAEALDVVSRTANVTVADDQLKVRDQTTPYVYSAWVDPYIPYADTWYLFGPRAGDSDFNIGQRIKAEFSWSPFILPEDIQVRMQDGTAVLTGTVSTYREREAAADSAIEAGAIAVDNQIKVG
ncbi:MAG: BON domain-containing protein [Polyangiaceae bacterium]